MNKQTKKDAYVHIGKDVCKKEIVKSIVRATLNVSSKLMVAFFLSVGFALVIRSPESLATGLFGIIMGVLLLNDKTFMEPCETKQDGGK